MLPTLPVVKVLYLFAGRRRHSDVAAFLRQAESDGKIKLVLKEFDIERSPMHDLTDVSLWDEIVDTLKEGGWCVIVSPPCNTFSRARFSPTFTAPRSETTADEVMAQGFSLAFQCKPIDCC